MAVPIAMWVTVHPGSVAVQQRIGGGSAHNPRREREPARALRQAGVTPILSYLAARVGFS